MQAYARQAKNKQLEIDASEIRFRAERRIGELMEASGEPWASPNPTAPTSIGFYRNPMLHRRSRKPTSTSRRPGR